VLHALTERLWPRLGSPRAWRRSTRQIFLLSLPVSLPLWLAAIIIRSVLILLGVAVLSLREFWSAPPKRRVSYYARDEHDSSAPVRLTIRRGASRRFFL